MAPGEKIFIPVFDLDQEPADHRPILAADARVAGSGTARMTTYVVGEGDSLWKIAHKAYGKGHRWNEIYEANRDLLATPDDLSVGQTLRIP